MSDSMIYVRIITIIICSICLIYSIYRIHHIYKINTRSILNGPLMYRNTGKFSGVL